MTVRSFALACAAGLIAQPFIGQALIGQAARAQSAPAPAAGAVTRIEDKPKRAPGYLAEAERPDAHAFVPAPPAPESPLGRADRATYEQTRALQGTPRWALATSDVREGAADILGEFGCAAGVELSASTAPVTLALLSRVRSDAADTYGPVKKLYARPRPPVGNALPICEADRAKASTSDSYPSGHATQGFLFALVLSELMPDRESQIVARGRAYGESRVVCGVHFPSDIEASRIVAAAVFARLQSHPGFQADLAKARAELAALRGSGAPAPAAAQCKLVEEAGAARPW